MINKRIQILKNQIHELLEQKPPIGGQDLKPLWDEVKDIVLECDSAYYEKDRPLISDQEYDSLLKVLEKIEERFPELRIESPSQKVSGKAASAFKKGTHRVPMLSLANSYNSEDIKEFNKRVLKFLDWPSASEPPLYFVQPKFDGLAIEVIYENGKLVRALTRGDGTTGEDVTSNVKTIRTLPHQLSTSTPPKVFEARGEILLFKEDFKILNAQQEADGEQPFANPRNAAAGSLRQLDAKITAARPLRIFFYSTGIVDGLEEKLSSQSDLENLMTRWGLPICNEFRICKNEQDVIDYYTKLGERRQDLPYDIDGVVVKVHSLELQNTLGTIARSPRWATALKFQPEQAQTQIEDIVVQVGRTGALTPVAVMKPVKVGGVCITHATLHNQDELNRKDVRIGDTVILQRAGDVIPEIVSVVMEKRIPNSEPFVIPKNCPSCGSPAVKPEDEAVSRCDNSQCPARLKESLKHFASRRAMNIEKVGDKIIDQLVDQKLVKKFSDLFLLKYEDLTKLPRQGEKSIQNILNQIEKAKKSTLARLIYAMGIRYVGEQTAKVLAKKFKSLTGFLNATGEQLLTVDEVGEKVAQSILDQLSQKSFRDELINIVSAGVELEAPGQDEGAQKKSDKLGGLTFVITGSLPGMSRDEAGELIESHGGTVTSSVSKKTSYLLCGEAPGSKFDKAQKLGVKIITYEELRSLLL